jgi:hypothetical protein
MNSLNYLQNKSLISKVKVMPIEMEPKCTKHKIMIENIRLQKQTCPRIFMTI